MRDKSERAKNRYWTKEETSLLMANIEKYEYDLESLPFNALMERLDRKYGSVYLKAQRLIEEAKQVCPVENKWLSAAFKLYLHGEPEGAILTKLQQAGAENVTLPILVKELAKMKKKFTEELDNYSVDLERKKYFNLHTLKTYYLYKVKERKGTLGPFDKQLLHRTIKTGVDYGQKMDD